MLRGPLPVGLVVLALTTSMTTTAASPAHAEVVADRIVAVVGKKAIALSELRRRARFAIDRAAKALPEGPERERSEAAITSEVLDRLIDEQVIANAAARANIVPTRDQVEKVVDTLAEVQNVPRARLFEGLLRTTGMDEAAYREEIRRQLLVGRLLTMRLAPRGLTLESLDEPTARREIAKMTEELRAMAFIEKRL